MVRFREADFYYGAVLSTLLYNHITPALIENANSRQVYNFTTDKGEFIAFFKYRAANRNIKELDSTRWDFNLQEDVKVIRSYIQKGKRVIMFLVCGLEALKDSELVIVDADELKRILVSNKTSITVGRKKGQHSYRISMPGGKENSIPIKCNKLSKLL